MALTEQQYIDLIVAEVGDDAASTLATTVPLYWGRHAGLADEARFLATKRDAIDVMLGRVRGQVRIVGVGGASIDAHQLTTHLQDMRALVQAQIESDTAASGAGGAVGALATPAPVPAPLGAFDANDRAYRGDPYRRTRRRL